MKTATILRRHADFASACLQTHTPGKAFAPHLSIYLKGNKSFGSKDRRRIRAMCYTWFRLGFGFELSLNNQVLLSYLILENEEKRYHESLLEQYNLPENWQDLTLDERLVIISEIFDWTKAQLFPTEMISEVLNPLEYLDHQLAQPLLWLNVKASEKAEVIKTIEQYKTQVTLSETGNIGVPVSTPIDRILSEDQYEIQDLSSQLALESLNGISFDNVWDCCAGSGGKSLNLGRKNKNLQIFVSDIRPNILRNLKERFRNHRLMFEQCVVDLQQPQERLTFVTNSSREIKVNQNHFDLVIADLPCTGSGTWNRNPEHVCFFEGIPENLLQKQKEILKNAWSFVKPSGHLLYLTCSVFEAENEHQIQQFQQEANVKVVNSGYIVGPSLQSDSMYYAVLKKI